MNRNYTNQYQFIVMYTISDDAVRNDLRDVIKNNLHGVELDESSYSIKNQSVGPIVDELYKYLKSVDMRNIDNDDFVKLIFPEKVRQNGNASDGMREILILKEKRLTCSRDVDTICRIRELMN